MLKGASGLGQPEISRQQMGPPYGFQYGATIGENTTAMVPTVWPGGDTRKGIQKRAVSDGQRATIRPPVIRKRAHGDDLVRWKLLLVSPGRSTDVRFLDC